MPSIAKSSSRQLTCLLLTVLALSPIGMAVADQQTPGELSNDTQQQSPWYNTACGQANDVPAGYVPPLVSNGSLSMLIDYLGGQTQRDYVRMTPCIWWAGRRYDPPASRMVPFGHFAHELAVDGEMCGTPAKWSQTLDTQSAVVTCHNEYANGLVVDTTVLTPLDHDVIVVRRCLTTKASQPQDVRIAFCYQFTPPGSENRTPRRVTSTCQWIESTATAEFRFRADGYRVYDGVIAILSDKPATATIDGQRVALTSKLTVRPAEPAELTTYVLLADSLDGNDYLERAANLHMLVRREGPDGLLATHRKAWADYWDQSYVHVPDEPLQRMYRTAQYHLRVNATRWSFPVGIFDTHWAGRYFGWDEMFCYQALASSNHLDVARRCPEFRKAGLPRALARNRHYGMPGIFGARYPWEAMEDGYEGAPPPGFWADHVFHMSNIALSAWMQYLYTNDTQYLQKTGYPIMQECARFFRAFMVYEMPDGSMFIGKCTDLERLGPARQNPFMTSCGAIYTMETAAKAAALLKVDSDEAAAWKHMAAELRESLPNNGTRYVPYADCEEESVASLGGLFPYPLFDATNPLQKNAAYWFIEKGQQSGNMYPVGKSLCGWYAGWLAAALARLEDTQEPARLLAKAAEGAGCFGEMFEINEPAVSRTPWFSTASGNVVYALNQMLLQSRDDRILIAAAVPPCWTDYSFRLACYGNLTAEVVVNDGRLRKLVLASHDANAQVERTLVLPAVLLKDVKLNPEVVQSMSEQGNRQTITVRFQGTADVIANKP